MSGELEFLFLTEEEMIEAGVLNMRDCVDTIEEMFELVSRGDYVMGGPNRNSHGLMLWFNEQEKFNNIPVAGPDRRFMSLIAYLGGRFDVIGNKWYGSNIENLNKGLPRSIHTFTLNDKATGAPLSIMAGNLISSVRTGAVPGVVSKHLARDEAKIIGAIGGGAINQSCVDAIVHTVESIEKVLLYDIDLDKGMKIAKSLESKVNVPVRAVNSIEDCLKESDIITVATSGVVKPELNKKYIKPGALIILTGAADISKDMYKNNRVVADLWSMHMQWLEEGLNHPDGISSILRWAGSGPLLKMIHNQEFNKNNIIDMGDIITGKKKGRKSNNEIIICITGGLPTEDVAWGYYVYENAQKRNIGTKLKLWNNSYLTE